jgi:hypothetical protein
MRQVNIHFVRALLDPLVGGADDDAEVARYRPLDPDKESGVRDVIRTRLKPYFDRFDVDSKEMARRSLQYFLSNPHTDFARVYDSNLLPIAAPSDPRKFFVWLWQELFGDEPFGVEDLGEFQENNDIHGPNSIRLEPSKGPEPNEV